jgi:hypothetical protein
MQGLYDNAIDMETAAKVRMMANGAIMGTTMYVFLPLFKTTPTTDHTYTADRWHFREAGHKFQPITELRRRNSLEKEKNGGIDCRYTKATAALPYDQAD